MSESGGRALPKPTIVTMKPTFAQLTHAVTTLAALVIVAVLAADHTIAGSTALAVLAAVTGTSLGIGANPPAGRPPTAP